MSVFDHLTFNNVISFDVYPSDVIGSKFVDVEVLALLDKDTASLYGIDPDQLHANVFPSLPPGTPDDPDQYQFVKLKQPNGTVSVIGVPWIVEESIKVSQRGVATITIEDVGPEEKNQIITALSAIGFRAASVTLK